MPQASIAKLLAELEGGDAGARKKKIAPRPAAPAPVPPRLQAGGHTAASKPAPAVPPPHERPRPHAPTPPPTPTRRANSDDMRAAMSEPLVKKAMDLFDGSLVNVEKLPSKPPVAETDVNEADTPDADE